jgi:hypothetical protein
MRPWLILALIAGCDGNSESDTEAVAGDTDVGDTDTDAPIDTDTDVGDTDPPELTVAITSPGDGTAWTVGDVVPLEATATWDDGSAASAVYTWTSDLAGPLGSGATVAWTATAGTHVLTVIGTGDGDQDEASVTVTVTEPVEEPLTRYGDTDGIPSSGVTWYDLDVMADGRVLGAASPGLMVFDGAAAWKGIGDGLATNEVRAVIEDSFGEVWIGYTGVSSLQGQRVSVDAAGAITVNAAVNINRTMEITEIVRIAEHEYATGENVVWFGSNEGLCAYDRAFDKYMEHLHPTHPHGDSRGLTFTADDDHWNGDGHQLSRWWYDHDGDISFTNDLIEYGTLWPVAVEEPIQIRDLASDGTYVYVASELFGFGVLDSTAASMAEGWWTPPEGTLPSASAVQVDRDGLVWIGASDGLWTYDPVTTDLQHVAALEITEAVEAIAMDEVDGSMWLGTATALWHAIGVPE